MLYDAANDTILEEVLKNAHYALPDGAGIFVAHQIQNNTSPKILKYLLFPYWCLNAIMHGPTMQEKYGERITGARLTRDLLEYANIHNISVTILEPLVLGHTSGDEAKRMSQMNIQRAIQEKYPRINCEVIV